LNIVPFLDTYLALSMAEQGHVNLAVERLWTLTDEMLRDGHLANVEVTLAFLAQILLSQGRIDEAGSAIERLVAVNRELRWATRDVAVLGLRARLALADGRGEDSTYRELRDRYRAMANDLGFEGHMAWAHAMP
jgi:adenylate cyclase